MNRLSSAVLHLNAIIIIQVHLLLFGIRAQLLSDADRNDVVNFHNRVRGEVSPPAADMREMRWDYELEALARSWAEKCRFYHPWNDDILPANEKLIYKGTSQSLVHQKGHSKSNFSTMLRALEYEKRYYRYGEKECLEDRQCTHYVNIIRADSYKVACVKHFCPANTMLNSPEPATIMVCAYAPGTYNYKSTYGEDLGLPYVKGDWCSKCREKETCMPNGKLCDPNSSSRLSHHPVSILVSALLLITSSRLLSV